MSSSRHVRPRNLDRLTIAGLPSPHVNSLLDYLSSRKKIGRPVVKLGIERKTRVTKSEIGQMKEFVEVEYVDWDDYDWFKWGLDWDW